MAKRFILILSLVSILISSCAPSATSTTSVASQHVVGAFESKEYRNLFREYLGKSDAEVQARIDAAWDQLFYGNDDSECVYYPVGEDMAYIEDIGNGDVRTEGMSYGMMIAVRLDANPASDGEEWFAMALLFASARWGDGEGIFDYRSQAQEILDAMLHKEDTKSDIATNMFDLKEKQVVFVPITGRLSSWSDPSYHLPAYYELWRRWAKRDNQFWADATQTSRAYFKKAAHPQTGLRPDYANFDGKPYGTDDHKDFRFDAWRTLSNVAVDYAWFAADPWQVEQSNRVLGFLASQGMDSYPNQFTLDGTPLSSDHSTGLVSMAAVAALAADRQTGEPFVQALWDTQIPAGQWRYYDGMLYILGMLHVSGNFKIYTSD